MFAVSVAVGSLVAAAANPAWAPQLVTPFLLAATVEGLLLGEAVPKNIAKFVHPLITCAVFANGATALFAAATGAGYKETLAQYITKVRSLHNLP